MQRLFSGILPPFFLLGLGLSLVACSMLEEEGPPAAVEDSRILLMEEEPEPETVQGVALDDEGNVVEGDLEIDPEGSLGDRAGAAVVAAEQGMTVYFEYDSIEVQPRFAEIIRQAATHLQNNPAGRLRLEGHTDERGTRAYNLALGERRAQSVRDMLLELGALPEQVDWVSYGEELPAVTGQSEDVWRRNRRVEIILEE